MRHPDGRGTTVPVRPGRDVANGTLRGILSDVRARISGLRQRRLRPVSLEHAAPRFARVSLGGETIQARPVGSWPGPVREGSSCA